MRWAILQFSEHENWDQVMVDFGRAYHDRSLLDLMSSKLRPGDIYTHLYHPNPDRGFDGRAGAPFDFMCDARQRGVIFDVGHGVGAFAWRVAEPACKEHGFWPDTISTDLHQFNLHGPVHDMPTTMTKFVHLGMPLTRAIRASTYEPARAMGLGERFGRLAVGRQADVTLMRLEEGRFELADVENQVRIARQRLVAEAVIKRGVYFTCDHGLPSPAANGNVALASALREYRGTNSLGGETPCGRD